MRTSPGPGTGSGHSRISSLRSPRKTTPRMFPPEGLFSVFELIQNRATVAGGPGHADLVALLAGQPWQVLRCDGAMIADLLEDPQGGGRLDLASSRKYFVDVVGMDDHVTHVDEEDAVDERPDDFANVVAADRHTAEAEDHAILRGGHCFEDALELVGTPEALGRRPGTVSRELHTREVGTLTGTLIELDVASELLGRFQGTLGVVERWMESHHRDARLPGGRQMA